MSEASLRTSDLIPLSVPPLVLPSAPGHIAQAEAAPSHALCSCKSGTRRYQTSPTCPYTPQGAPGPQTLQAGERYKAKDTGGQQSDAVWAAAGLCIGTDMAWAKPGCARQVPEQELPPGGTGTILLAYQP